MSALTQKRGWMFAALAALGLVGLGVGVGVAQRGEPASPPIDEQALQHAEALSTSFRSVAKSASPSIVSIVTITKGQAIEQVQFPFDDNSPFKRFFEDDPQLKKFFEDRQFQQPRKSPSKQGMGSGFVIDEKGVILTNSHVVKGADEVKIRFSDGREFLATDIKTDPRADVAIVRFEAPKGLKAIPLGDSAQMEVGDWVLAIGSPFGLDTTVTSGIISAKGRVPGINQREDYLQTDAAINPGNSGGPLLNLRGEVIGINTAISSRGGGNDGIGFAIPINMAKWVAKQLIENGEVQRGFLGVLIQDLNGPLAKQLDITTTNGALVQEVLKDSPAAKAGLKPGDVVMKLNGNNVSSPKTLQDAVEKLAIGQKYELVILRDGKEQALGVTIEKMPTGDLRASTSQHESSNSRFDQLGLDGQELTSDLQKQLNLENAKGVLISKVQSDSLADKAGLKVGDVIEKVGRTKVQTKADLEKAINRIPKDEGVLLLVHNKNGSRFVVLP